MFYSVNLIATEIQTCDIWQQNLSRNRQIENNHWMIRVSVPIATFLKLNELWPMVGGVPADLASPLPEPPWPIWTAPTPKRRIQSNDHTTRAKTQSNLEERFKLLPLVRVSPKHHYCRKIFKTNHD